VRDAAAALVGLLLLLAEVVRDIVWP